MKTVKIIALLLMSTFFAQGQEVSKNGIALELGFGGGDGIFPTYLYGLEYTRDINSRISGYFKYSISNGTEYWLSVEDRHKSDKNTAVGPNTRFGQFVFIGTGINLKLVKTERSFLYVIGGVRYTKGKRSYSDESINDNNMKVASANNYQENVVGYEIGLGYKKKFANKYFAGGSINHESAQLRFSVSALIGVYF